MSGIAGLYYLDGRPVDTDINRMVDKMEHRGPDEQAVWTSGPVGIGHCMLHTTPESLHASLPQESSQSGCVITADARIDNREDLIQGLRLPTDPDRVIPDTTLILRAYEEWGRDCVQHLLGAFSFAIWDPREEHAFCAIDHFGVRPLYYYHEQRRIFAFASEIKSLLALDDVPEEPDEVRLADHLLTPIEEDSTRTYFKDISGLAPAHVFTVGPNHATETQYWALDPSQEVQLSSDEEYAERFHSLFRDAVGARLRSTTPVGCMLSGGLDSSSIACQAAKMSGRSSGSPSVHTFSAVFGEETGSDESPYIKSVLSKYDELQPHFIQGDEKSPLADWDELYEYVDGACTAGNIYIFWRSNRSARDHGIRVMLDGFDGDTTVSYGKGFFYELREEGRLLRLATEAALLANHWGESPRHVAWNWVKGSVVSLPVISQLMKVRQYLKGQSEDAPERHMGPAWQNMLSEETARKVAPHVSNDNGSAPKTDHEHHRAQLDQAVMKRILDLWNQVGAASSVETRYPFYDKRLVEFCLALPPEQKIRWGWDRFVMRRAMEGVLPSAVQWREDKGDLSLALDENLIAHERPLLNRLMDDDFGGVDRFVSSDHLREAVRNYLDGKTGSGHEGKGLFVWRALSLALWLRHRDL
ncbi:asparagine synthase (glutamine-hydrolyzing) [Salinibacter grassmerensis]|uniref:asparagine synthase (glutamine-hydrolyzing) n=1 Tax=Salinibacter grassmerensis TaxID=3040353 RepID=UPI0021E7E827|nr:asparagine synthase (glutamine-hydrolyzing) [Salinibacter grassmerensis]